MEYDIIIIGAGPAGYVAAIRAGQLGMKTALIEKQYMGGMCLNWGCIPTKSLIESARTLQTVKNAAKFGVQGVQPETISLDWNVAKQRAMGIVNKLTLGVEWLVKKSGVDIIMGEATINGSGSVTVNNQHFTATRIIIATGSKPASAEIPVPAEKITDIEKLMAWEMIPSTIAIVGKGAVAVELAQFFSMAGSKVSLLTTEGDFLPGIDEYLMTYLWKTLEKSGVKVYKEAVVTGYKDGFLLTKDEKIPCDVVLNASWRKGVIPPSGIPIETSPEGYIVTDVEFETSIPGVFAIGDVNGRAYLAHVASAQGIWLINHFKGIRNTFDLNNYPYNIYTTPEIAQVGMTEQQLQEAGIQFRVNEFPLSANGKALTEGNAEGFIRMLSEDRYGQVMGVQIFANNATDMIAEASAFMSIEGTVYDVAQTIHAHPTVSEIFMEAGFDAVDKAIHK